MELSKHCLHCGNVFYKTPNNSRKYWLKKRFCSIICNNKSRIGIKQTSDSNYKRSKSMQGKRNSLGTIRSLEYKKHLSDYWKDNPNHNHYKDGKGKERSRFVEMGRLEYRVWRTSVFERDNYTCQLCGQKGGKLNADHIKAWVSFPELRYDVDNGRTLCFGCHKLTDTYAGRIFKGEGTLTKYKKENALMKKESIAKGKKVICSVTGNIYESIIDAANAIGVKKWNLERYLNGSRTNKTTMSYYKV